VGKGGLYPHLDRNTLGVQNVRMNNNREVRLSVRISRQDKELIQESAKILGLSESKFIRQACKELRRKAERIQREDRERITITL